MFALLISVVSLLSNIILVAGHPTIENPWEQVDQIIRQKTLIPSIKFYNDVVQAIEYAQQKNPTLCISMNAEKKLISHSTIRDKLIQIAQLNREPLTNITIDTQIALFSEIRRILPSTDPHSAQFERDLIEAYKKQIHVSLWGDQPNFETAKTAIDNMLFIRRLPEAEDYWKKQRKHIVKLEKKMREESLGIKNNMLHLTILSNLYAKLYHYPTEEPLKKNKIIAELEKAIKTEKAIRIYDRAQQHDANNHARLLAMSCCLANQQPYNPLWQCALVEKCYLTLLSDLEGSPYFKDFSDNRERDNIRDAIHMLELIKPSNPTVIMRFIRIKKQVSTQLDSAEYLDRLTPIANLCDPVGHRTLIDAIGKCQINFAHSTTAVMLAKRKSNITRMHKTIMHLSSEIRTITKSEDRSHKQDKKVLALKEKCQQVVLMSNGFAATHDILTDKVKPIVRLATSIQGKQQVLAELKSEYARYQERLTSCND